MSPPPRGAGNPKGGFSIERNFSSNLDAHCPKNSLNLRIKTGPVTAGADATVYSMSGFYAQCITQYMYVHVAGTEARHLHLYPKNI